MECVKKLKCSKGRFFARFMAVSMETATTDCATMLAQAAPPTPKPKVKINKGSMAILMPRPMALTIKGVFELPEALKMICNRNVKKCKVLINY